MLFIFKKIVSHFLFPLPLCVFIIIIGTLYLWFSRKKLVGKIVVTSGVILLLIFSYGTLPAYLLRSLEYEYSYLTEKELHEKSDNNKIKWIVVIARGHDYREGVPMSSMLTGDTLFCLVEGIRLHKKLPSTKLILSGGNVGDEKSQAEIMSNVAISLGVPEKDISLEINSLNTLEQAEFVKKIVKTEKFILVALTAHMPRTMALFEKQGMHPIPSTAGHRSTLSGSERGSNISLLRFFPNIEALRGATLAFYEHMGLIWAKVTDNI